MGISVSSFKWRVQDLKQKKTCDGKRYSIYTHRLRKGYDRFAWNRRAFRDKKRSEKRDENYILVLSEYRVECIQNKLH